MSTRSNITRISSLFKRVIFAFLSIISIEIFFAGSAFANTSVVNCGGSDDTSAIQSAIDNASSGDVIQLVGVCQLNDTTPIIQINTSNITIKGAGAAGNWSTVLSGCTVNGCYPSATGIPLGRGPSPTYLYRNDGFEIGPTNGTISNVMIKGIKFHNLNVPVLITPSIAGGTALCAGISVTSGNASNISVTNNVFDNDRAAVFNAGLSDHINITNNLITNSGFNSYDIVSEEILGCLGGGTEFPSDDHPTSGAPSNVVIDNNVINTNDQASIPIDIFGVHDLDISNNSVMAGSNGYVNILFAADTATVSQNLVDGGGVAAAGIFDNINVALDNNNNVFLSPYSSMKNSISNNKVSNVVLADIGLDSAIFGTSVVNNVFDLTSVVNIFLCDATSSANLIAANLCDGGYAPGPGGGSVVASNNNKIITTNFANTVMDFGFQNKLIGSQNLLNNANVPSSVKFNLIQGITGKPQLP